MSALPAEVDLLVVGAGTAGAALAGFAAERGLSVLCVDRGPLEHAGAQWVNAVPGTHFDAAGIARPSGDERRPSTGTMHMQAGHGPERIVVRGHDMVETDMRLLRARLERLAREVGARFEGEVEVCAVDGRQVRTVRGTVRADAIVDASGLAGIRLLGAPPHGRRDLCTAAQSVHRIAHRAGAQAFLDAHGFSEGDVFCRAGLAGGYSILNVSVHDDEVSLLTGTIPADGHTSGGALLDDFVRTQPWIGPRLFGGRRAIPLGRPHVTIARGRHAAIGDAAGQVFSAHGSGIGAGILAARQLAITLAQDGDLEGWAADWQRQNGGVLAAYDLFRRFSQSLSTEEVADLMRAGLLDPETARPALQQVMPRLGPGQVLARARRLGGHGRIGARMARLGARIAAVMALYAAYPRHGPRDAWTRAVARAAGDAAWNGA